MSNLAVSAAGGAMPAEGHKTRRAALALFGAAPALALLPAAAGSHAHAEVFELIARWRELDARACALNEQIWALEDATEVKEPDALIKTAEDADLFTTD